MLHAARCNTGRKKVAKNRHLGTIAQLRRAIVSFIFVSLSHYRVYTGAGLPLHAVKKRDASQHRSLCPAPGDGALARTGALAPAHGRNGRGGGGCGMGSSPPSALESGPRVSTGKF